MDNKLLIGAVVLGLGVTMPAWAGNAAAGKEKSAACAACHGPDGNSVAPNFPKLAGQHADYLAHSLKEYRSKKRVNAIMNGQAEKLTDQDIADLAAFYASQKGLTQKR